VRQPPKEADLICPSPLGGPARRLKFQIPSTYLYNQTVFFTERLDLLDSLVQHNFNAAFPGKLAKRRTPGGGRGKENRRERMRAAPRKGLLRRFLIWGRWLTLWLQLFLAAIRFRISL